MRGFWVVLGMGGIVFLGSVTGGGAEEDVLPFGNNAARTGSARPSDSRDVSSKQMKTDMSSSQGRSAKDFEYLPKEKSGKDESTGKDGKVLKGNGSAGFSPFDVPIKGNDVGKTNDGKAAEIVKPDVGPKMESVMGDSVAKALAEYFGQSANKTASGRSPIGSSSVRVRPMGMGGYEAVDGLGNRTRVERNARGGYEAVDALGNRTRVERNGRGVYEAVDAHGNRRSIPREVLPADPLDATAIPKVSTEALGGDRVDGAGRN